LEEGLNVLSASAGDARKARIHNVLRTTRYAETVLRRETPRDLMGTSCEKRTLDSARLAVLRIGGGPSSG
jgi:hypothetical protein